MDADTVFTLHDVYDHAHESDSDSRYQAYLAYHGHRFHYREGKPTVEPAEFAAAALVIASTPIMSPPYVGTHPRVVHAWPQWDMDQRCALLIELALPLTASIADQLPPHFVGWRRDQYTGRYHPPDSNEQPVACTRLAVTIPLPVELLPSPAYTGDGVAEVHTAKRAIRTVCAHANSILTHLIVSLDTHHDDDHADGQVQRLLSAAATDHRGD